MDLFKDHWAREILRLFFELSFIKLVFGKTDVANPVVAKADRKFLLFINCCLISKYKFNFEALKTVAKIN